LREFIAAEAPANSTHGRSAPRPPEHLQVIEELPRRPTGEVRSEILQLVAMNQLDLIDPLIASEQERTLVAHIVADRRNLRDRTAF
jgi:hypothetical protein